MTKRSLSLNAQGIYNPPSNHIFCLQMSAHYAPLAATFQGIKQEPLVRVLDEAVKQEVISATRKFLQEQGKNLHHVCSVVSMAGLALGRKTWPVAP